jgi:Tfp pilus assembly protein PilO
MFHPTSFSWLSLRSPELAVRLVLMVQLNLAVIPLGWESLPMKFIDSMEVSMVMGVPLYRWMV